MALPRSVAVYQMLFGVLHFKCGLLLLLALCVWLLGNSFLSAKQLVVHKKLRIWGSRLSGAEAYRISRMQFGCSKRCIT